MKKSRFTESQIVSILNQQHTGQTVKEICREHGISDAQVRVLFTRLATMPHTLSPPTAGQSLAQFDPEMDALVKEERDRQFRGIDDFVSTLETLNADQEQNHLATVR